MFLSYPGEPETLVEAGCIDSLGVANAFTVKLAQAEAAIADGRIQDAINTLTGPPPMRPVSTSGAHERTEDGRELNREGGDRAEAVQNATPSSQTFTWRGALLTLQNFGVN